MKFAITVFLCFLIAGIHAQEIQRCKVTRYKSEEGLPGQIIKSITADENGFIWMVSENHLQYFDGSTFHILPMGHGIHEIPGKIFQSVYHSPEKEVWIFYTGGFSVYAPKTHSFCHSPGYITFNHRPLNHITNLPNEIIIHNGSSYFSINRHTKSISALKQGKGGAVTGNSYSKTGKAFEVAGDKIFPVSFLPSTPGLQPINFAGNYIYPFETETNKLLVFTTDAVWVVDSGSNEIKSRIDYPINLKDKAYKLPQSVVPGKKETYLVSLDNQVWELDLKTLSFTRTFTNLNGENPIKKGYCKNMFLDNQNNLWVSTNLNGLLRFNLDEKYFKLYATGGEENNFIKCFLVDEKANRVISGTYGNGILVYNSMGKLLKKVTLSNQTIVTTISKVGEQKCIFLLYGHYSPYLFDYKNYTYKKLPIINHTSWQFSTGYYSELIPLGNNNFYFEVLGSPLLITFKNDTLFINPFPSHNPPGLPAPKLIPSKYLSLDPFFGKNYIANCLSKFGMEEIGSNCVYPIGNRVIFGTVKGIFIFSKNGKFIRQYGVQNGLPDEMIYALLVDRAGNIWCSHNLGLSCILPNGEIKNFSKSDGLQDNEFNYGAAFATTDGQLFFGGINGISSFYPQLLNNINPVPNLLITKIRVNETDFAGDTAYWSYKSLELPHSQNRIQLKLSAVGSNPASAYYYQYRIKEINQEWKNLKNSQEINLALPPGTYTIEAAASENFNRALKAQLLFTITVNSPVYLRWWFIASSLVVIMVILWLLAKYFNQKKYRQKLRMQQTISKERHRISRDLHDNIGAYTTALLANTDKLEKETSKNEVVSRIRKNAQQILASLRNTIWILNNNNIQISELNDNFKNYCFKVLQNFEQITLEVEEDITMNLPVSSSDALHLNNLMQEAVQNIIKHSNAHNISYIIRCNGSLYIEISDDGIGYIPETATKGYGLENMQWRAKEAGAQLNISSYPGRGTTIAITKKCSKESIVQKQTLTDL